MNRREFIRDTLTASGIGLFTAGAAGSRSKGKVPLAMLGRTGQSVSRLGVGCGIYIRSNLTGRDMEVILETALDAGINYVDTPPAYKDVQAQIGPIVRRIRDRIFLVSKVEECTYDGAWRQLRQSLKDLQTDRLDLVHLHSLGNVDRWPDLKAAFSDDGALGALREAKRQGVIRFIGANGHNYPSRFHAALDTGEIDVLMNAVNFVIRHSLDFEHKLWSRAHQENIGLAVQMYAQEYDDFVPRAMDHQKAKWVLVFIPFLGSDNTRVEDYRDVDVYQCPSFPRTGVGLAGRSNGEQTVDYVVNAWDMDDPGLSTGNKGRQKDTPTKLHAVPRGSERIYLADNEAGDWRPIIRDRYELDMLSNMNVLDVWSTTHLPGSTQTNSGNNLTRRIPPDRHRNGGCNNLFFDGHADWLKADENTSRYWCGVDAF